jgi:hypothetical protein
MADTPTPPQTDPNAKGSRTTEGRLTIANSVTGGLAILAGVVTAFQGLRDAFPGVPWIAGVLAAVGAVQMVAVSLGFTKLRTDLKVEQVRAAVDAGQRAANLITTNAEAKRYLEQEPPP